MSIEKNSQKLIPAEISSLEVVRKLLKIREIVDFYFIVREIEIPEETPRYIKR